MSAEAWTLKGVDPRLRDEVREAAAQAGLSIGEYLSRALRPEADKETPSAASTIYRDASAGAGELYQARRFGQRLDALEQRSQHTIAGVDRAIGMMDRTVLDLTHQIEAAEAVAEGTAAQLAAAVERFRTAAETLGGRIDAEAAQSAELRTAHERLDADFAAAHGALRADIAAVEARIGDTESAAAQLARNLETLESAVDARVDELTAHTLDLIGDGLAEARAAADAASLAADAAVSAAIADIRAFEQAIDARLDAREAAVQENLERVRAEGRAAHAALMQRLDASEGETEAALSNLAQDFAHVLDTLNIDLYARLAELDAHAKSALAAGLSEAQGMADEAALRSETAAADAVEALRVFRIAAEARIEAGERQARAELESALDEARALHASLSQRVEAGEDETARAHQALVDCVADIERDLQAALINHAETGRAALETLADEITLRTHEAGRAHQALADHVTGIERDLHAALNTQADTERAALEALAEKTARRQREADDAHRALRETLEIAGAEARERDAGIAAHLRLIDAALAATPQASAVADLEAALAAQTERVAELEDAQSLHASAADVDARFAELESADLPGRIAAAVRQFDDKLRAAVTDAKAETDAWAAETTAHTAQTAAQLEAEISGVRAVLDQRVSALAGALAAATDSATANAATLVQAAGAREAAARNALANELRALLDERDARLSQRLDATGDDGLAQRLDDVERRDAAAVSRLGLEILAANERIGQRISDVERRCVEAIQTIGEVVSQIDDKLNRRQDQFSRSLAEHLGLIETQLANGRRKQA